MYNKQTNKLFMKQIIDKSYMPETIVQPASVTHKNTQEKHTISKY